LEPGAAGDRFENGPAADDRIRRALPGDPDTIYRNIERVCRQKNQPIRELLRKQMGLGLKPETQDSIVVSVHDGLPAPFARLVAAKPAIPWELAARAELLSHSEEGLRFLLDRFEAVSRDYFDERPPAGRGDLERSRTLVEAILHDVEERKLRAELKAIAEDILGAYFFRRRGIEIYWLVIGFMAGLLRVSEESLATVVLTHELAHAFTHAGSDTDGHRWETKSFAAAPSEVIEGLAQFYTEAVCTKIAEREPGPLAAFHRLLRYQSEAYSSFQEWTRGSSNPRETIRAALVEARARGISTARDFQEFREKHRR
jgi:hypothetical protein